MSFFLGLQVSVLECSTERQLQWKPIAEGMIYMMMLMMVHLYALLVVEHTKTR